MARGEIWPVERIKNGLERFFKEYGRYPTATEFDEYAYLPRAKTAERKFGGLVALRKKLGLETTHDLRLGAYRSDLAQHISKRAHVEEQKVYDFLIKRFGREFVHREYFYTDDHRTRADFFVYDNTDGFCVDVFYAQSLRNVSGCLNIKLKKYANVAEFMTYPIVFLQVNPDISQIDLDTLVENKKRGLGKRQTLMSWETFVGFCKGRTPLSILSGGSKKRSA
ncbi:MAG: hypothetical protein AAB480_04555 [Patescibacteria group bacterium]